MYSLSSLLILSAFLFMALTMVAVDAGKIKIHLNYNNHDEEMTQRDAVSITNTHTGAKIRGVGNTVSSRVSAENLKEVEQVRSQPTYYSKVDRKQVPEEFMHEQRSLDENFRQLSNKKQQQQPMKKTAASKAHRR